MSQKDDESMEDYVDIFQYNHQCSKFKLEKPALKNLLLKCVRDECMELLNLMGGGDISCQTYDYVYEICKRYHQGLMRNKNDV